MITTEFTRKMRIAYIIAGMTVILFTLLYSCKKEEIFKVDPNLKSSAGSYITYSDDLLCLGETLDVTFNNGYNNNCGNIQLQMSTDEGITWVQVASGTPTNGSLIYSFIPPSADSYLFRGKWNATGGPSCSSTGANIGFTAGTATFAVIVSASCCETGFSGEAISCDTTREAVYTFTSTDSLGYIKIQGGLTNFTGADAIITVIGGDLTVSQWTPGGSSNRIIKVEGSVEACEEITIRITWNSTNGGDIITGDWSVKDAEGVELAPSVQGLECGL